MEIAPKVQPAPTAESQHEEKAAPAPKGLDLSTARSKAPGKKKPALEKMLVKEQSEEKPKRSLPARGDKPPAEKPMQPRYKMFQSMKTPGKDTPTPKQPEAVHKEVKTSGVNQPAFAHPIRTTAMRPLRATHSAQASAVYRNFP